MLSIRIINNIIVDEIMRVRWFKMILKTSMYMYLFLSPSLSLPSPLQTEMETAFSPEARRYLTEMLALEKMLNTYQV